MPIPSTEESWRLFQQLEKTERRKQNATKQDPLAIITDSGIITDEELAGIAAACVRLFHLRRVASATTVKQETVTLYYKYPGNPKVYEISSYEELTDKQFEGAVPCSKEGNEITE